LANVIWQVQLTEESVNEMSYVKGKLPHVWALLHLVWLQDRVQESVSTLY